MLKTSTNIDIDTVLADFYLDWVNNYLTIAKMAADYGLEEDECQTLIEIGRKMHEKRVSYGR